MRLDQWLSICLVPLALWILLSGLDDLFISLVSLVLHRERLPRPADSDLEHTPERRIALFVPLWHEHGVIGRMLERNFSVIHYENYEVFAGVYPNDPLTCDAVSEAARRHRRVHPVVCPHAGPTSKGDCLNWIYRGMEEYERLHGVRFDVVVTHDAEDLIHPQSLRYINCLSREYQMVQIPVLPLPTGLRELTHGLYCDEFAEYQSKDIPVRQFLGGFLPSNGVGTGFDRGVLGRLAVDRGGQVFDPACLTEDYENGYRLHALGCRQTFVPLRFDSTVLTATREYFPRTFRRAVRQRSRWVTGIVLQGWQLHGWRAPRRQLYWFWRDRKGLIGNLLAPFANFLLLAGITLKAPELAALGAGALWRQSRHLRVSGVPARRVRRPHLRLAVRLGCPRPALLGEPGQLLRHRGGRPPVHRRSVAGPPPGLAEDRARVPSGPLCCIWTKAAGRDSRPPSLYLDGRTGNGCGGLPSRHENW